MHESIDFLKSIIHSNDTIVVACSGGPDSMCLLSLLCILKKTIDFELIVAHVNHKIRKESDKEALMVQKFCKENGLIIEIKELIEFKNEKWNEEIARKKRYLFFDELMCKYEADYLLTAHHGDDLMETILMRISRGSTLSGYIGIKLKNNNILRPLLFVDKDSILKYVNENNIPYAIDKSNEDLTITRNRYRHYILPFLKKEDNNINRKYLKFSQELEEYEKFVNEYINSNELIVDNYIDINKINREGDFIKRKTIELLIKNIQANDLLIVNDQNMQDILKLFNKSNKSVDLNNNYQAINNYGKLMIIKKVNECNYQILLDKDITINGFNIYYNSQNGDNSNNAIMLLSEDIKLPLIVRNWRDGDVMSVKNLGLKKVSDIFINSKIPRYKRDSYPLIVDSAGNILLIPGVKKSKFAKDKSEKYDIIVKCEAR